MLVQVAAYPPWAASVPSVYYRDSREGNRNIGKKDYLCGMEFIPTAIDGVFIVEPKVFKDARGYFFESFSKRDFDEKALANLGHTIDFVQDNESMSSYGVVRGLHYQKMPYTQTKLVRCVRGKVLDVALDIRVGSPTYGQHVAVELTEENHRMLLVPRGFAHGFSVLSETAVFQYKCDNFYHPEADAGLNLTDPSLKIDWRIPMDKAILSEKDLKHPSFAQMPQDFKFSDKLY